jgi:hypothetical protein
MKAVASVFSTTDYFSFKKLNGNREVMESRKKLLMESIVERGWIRNPIVVNEKMEIIDGQGRFEALKELRLPVEYVFATGATIQDCINLNVKQKNWTNADYISSYAANGVPDYVILQNAINTHNTLGANVIQIMLCRFFTDSGKTVNDLKNGTFKVSDPDGVDDILFFAEKVFEIIGLGNGRLRIWATAIKFVYYCDKIDKIRFMKQLSAHHIMLTPIATIRQCLTVLERIYNYNYSKKNKVYFIPEYEKATLKTIR